jgi:hypothetical protein
MTNQRGLLGNVVRDVGMPRNGELLDDQVDGESRGDAPGRSRTPRKRRPPITEKGKGRNLKIPDSVFRRLELEALRLQTDNSKLVTKILDRELPKNIKVVIGDEEPVATE